MRHSNLRGAALWAGHTGAGMHRRATAIRADMWAVGEHPIWEEKVQAGTAGYRPANHGVDRAGSVFSDLPG